VLFAIPWHDKLVVGTTDTPNVPVSVEPRALPEEVAFIMDHAQSIWREIRRRAMC